jgi:translocation and assembly module TamB
VSQGTSGAPVPPNPANPRFKNWGRLGVSLALGLTAAGLGVFWYGRYFLNQRLAPLVEAELEKTLQRPVELGEVDRVGLGGVKFGDSVVPPTDDQANFLTAESIDVQVDLWSYFRDSQVGLDVVVQSPQIFLRQDAAGGFLPEISPPESEGKQGVIDLRTVTINDAKITLQTEDRSGLVSLSDVDVTSTWSITDPNAQSVEFNAAGNVVLPIIEQTAAVPDPATLAAAIASQPTDNGAVTITGNWDLTTGQGDIQTQAQNLLVTAVKGFIPQLPFTPIRGRVDGDLNLAIRPGTPTPEIYGDLKVRDTVVTVPSVPEPFTDIAGRVVIDGSDITLEGMSAKYETLVAQADGTISPSAGFNLDVALAPTDLATAIASFSAEGTELPVEINGEVEATATVTGSFENPLISAAFNSTQDVVVDRVTLKDLSGVVVNEGLTTFKFNSITATPVLTNAQGVTVDGSTGSLQGSGEIRLPEGNTPPEVLFAFNVNDFTAEAIATTYEFDLPIAVGNLAAAVQVYGNFNNLQVVAQVDAPAAEYPTNAEVLISGGVATIRDTLVQLPMGTVAVNGSINLSGNNAWQATLSSNNIPLDTFAPGQTGVVSGVVNLDSSTGSFELSQITANADLSLPEGAAAIPDPIAARLNWDGNNLVIPSLSVGNYLTGSGQVALVFNDQQLPTDIASVNLDLDANNVSVNRLSSFAPKLAGLSSGSVSFNGNIAGALDDLEITGDVSVSNLAVGQLATTFLPANANEAAPTPTGAIAFNGTISGPISDPQLNGKVRLNNLSVEDVAFDPTLSGPLSYNRTAGLNLDLQGQSSPDQIALKLNSDFQPTSFTVQLAQATATGQRIDDNRLAIDVNDLPVPLIAALAGQTGNFDGRISGQLVADFGGTSESGTPGLVVSGDVAIDRPRFGRVQAEQATAKLAYANGNLRITDGVVDLSPYVDQQSQYRFELAYLPQSNTPLQANFIIEQGRVQDVFATLQWFQLTDIADGFDVPEYGNAADLASVPTIGQANAELYSQLEYYSQINARIDQRETIIAAQNRNLPPLEEFTGQINGTISITQTDTTGVKFDVTGSNWEYGKFAIDDVIAKGSFVGDELALETLRMESTDSQGRIAYGQITDARIGLLQQSGRVELANFPIESLRPLGIYDTIPVEVSGDANGVATIGGNIFNPSLSGEITLADATINRQPLEAVSSNFNYASGRFKFDSTFLVSGPEPVLISGDIPFRLPGTLVRGGNDIDLTIEVQNEGLAVVNIFTESVRWEDGMGRASLVVSGTKTRPQVQGEVVLDGATVKLAALPEPITNLSGDVTFSRDRLTSNLTGLFSDGELTAQGVLAVSDPNLITPADPDFELPLTISANNLALELKNLYSGGVNGFFEVRGAALDPVIGGTVALYRGTILIPTGQNRNGTNTATGVNIGFNQLAVRLTDDVQVALPPVLNLLAEGEIEVNGSLNNILPDGRVNILRGQLNAISARFRLDRSHDNYAEFMANNGLNPTLNVRMRGAVPEVTRTPVPTSPLDPFEPDKIPVSNLGAQRTIDVQATVTGTAQNPNIELRSTPPRTEAEILALIGGGILEGGNANPTAALVNLAGGTIISFLQDAIGDALNLSEFNLRPATSDTEGSESTLGLAAEAAIDISNSFSVSVSTILNDPAQATNYTLRYRLNPNTLIRGNVDDQGREGIAIEYENRF